MGTRAGQCPNAYLRGTVSSANASLQLVLTPAESASNRDRISPRAVSKHAANASAKARAIALTTGSAPHRAPQRCCSKPQTALLPAARDSEEHAA